MRGRLNMQLATKVANFAALSAVGLAIDMGVFSVLVYCGLRPGYANLVSATLAVTFVYFSSAKRVFQYHGQFLVSLFLLYVTYQVMAVLAASFAVDRLVTMGFWPITSKLLILPVTFTVNYLFMSFLLKAKT
jgi:putative flippase GtrA